MAGAAAGVPLRPGQSCSAPEWPAGRCPCLAQLCSGETLGLACLGMHPLHATMHAYLNCLLPVRCYFGIPTCLSCESWTDAASRQRFQRYTCIHCLALSKCCHISLMLKCSLSAGSSAGIAWCNCIKGLASQPEAPGRDADTGVAAALVVGRMGGLACAGFSMGLCHSSLR